MGEGRTESTRADMCIHYPSPINRQFRSTHHEEKKLSCLAVNRWPQIDTHKAQGKVQLQQSEQRGEAMRLTADLEAIDSFPCCIVTAAGE